MVTLPQLASNVPPGLIDTIHAVRDGKTSDGVRLPTFFLGGVAKAGTTSLHAYLQQHPQVFMSPIKEPWFFGVADLLSPPYGEAVRAALEEDHAWLQGYLDGPQPPGVWRYVREWNDYVRLFRDVRDETAIGEASTSYLWLPSVAGIIWAVLPHARFAFVLRDPAERLFTLYLRTLWRDPLCTFQKWFRDALETPHLWPSIVGAARYATHLERYAAIWPRKQLRVYLYEDYRADPRAVLRDLFTYVGVDPDAAIDVSRRRNETVAPRFLHLHALRRRLFGSVSPSRWLPASVREALRRVYRARRSERTMGTADRGMVIEYYRQEILRTAEFLGRDLSAWLR